jgi:hypothetical protein
MVPVGIITECVAVKPRVIEIVQTVEILRCKLVVSELVVRELIVSELIVAKLIVAGECVATGVFEIVTGHAPRITGHCVVVSEIMGSEVAAHSVTTKSVCVHGVSRKAMSAQPASAMPAATSAANSMEPTGSAMKPSKPTAATVKPSAATTSAVKPSASATPSGKCGDFRHDAKRAHCNARRQNSYHSLLHGAFPTRSSKFVAARARLTFNYRVRRSFQMSSAH